MASASHSERRVGQHLVRVDIMQVDGGLERIGIKIAVYLQDALAAITHVVRAVLGRSLSPTAQQFTAETDSWMRDTRASRPARAPGHGTATLPYALAPDGRPQRCGAGNRPRVVSQLLSVTADTSVSISVAAMSRLERPGQSAEAILSRCMSAT